MRARLFLLGCLASCLATSRATAQRVSLEALTDLTVWKTGDSSALLARNGDQWAVEGGLHLWAMLRPVRSLEFTALGATEGGRAEPNHFDAEFELLSVRFTPSRAFGVEAGRLLMPIGSFGRRRLSDTNPLIGSPDMYPTQYPWAAVMSGAMGPLDYRAGVMSDPAVNARYTPPPSARARPVVGIGFSAGPSLRVGINATHGTYLSRDETSFMPAGRTWDQYAQTIVGGEARLSIGYVESHAEVAWSSYEAPTAAHHIRGLGFYLESRATVTPRLFIAARLEYFKYPFILPINPFFWVDTTTTEMNAEIGIGYRLAPALLIKTSLRKDHWPDHNPGPGVFLPDGYAFAVQASWRLYPLEWLRPRY